MGLTQAAGLLVDAKFQCEVKHCPNCVDMVQALEDRIKTNVSKLTP